MLHKKSEKGQAIIMIVFSIIGLIGLTALTVDGGMAYMDRRSAQGAADSGAWAAGLANARETVGDTDGDGFNEPDVTKVRDAAYLIAERNGYFNDDGDHDDDASNSTRTDVFVTVEPLPIAPAPLVNGEPNPCPDGAAPNVEITVTITSYVSTFFAPVIGIEQVTNRVQTVTRACGTYIDSIFGGQAIFTLGEDVPAGTCAFDGGNSDTADWIVKCSGIHSNTCAWGKNALDDAKGPSITLDEGQCVSAVGGVNSALEAQACTSLLSEIDPSFMSTLDAEQTTQNLVDAFNDAGWDLSTSAVVEVTQSGTSWTVTDGDLVYIVEHENGTLKVYIPSPITDFDLEYAESIMPDNPCVDGGVGLPMPALPKKGYFKLSPDEDGNSVYCVDDASSLKEVDLELDGVTLYFTEEVFELKYSGGTGSIYGTPTQSGEFSSYSVVVPLPENKSNFCTDAKNDKSGPNLDYRGNASGVLYGTVLAPSACITMAGNAGTHTGDLKVVGQVVANVVASNGNSTSVVDYCQETYRREPKMPTIELVH